MIYKGAPIHFKDIILVSPPVKEGSGGFFDPIIQLIEFFGYREGKEFHVVKDEMVAMEKLQILQKEQRPEKPMGHWSTNGHHPILAEERPMVKDNDPATIE
jgi:hypothetical protein